MSMLLDALKKSEEQRQLGTTPDIHSPADHVPQSDGRTAGLWLPTGLIAVAVVAMAWFGWKQFERPETAMVPPQVAERAAADPQSQPEVAVSPAPNAEGEARTPVENYAGAATSEPGDAPVNNERTSERQQVSQSFNQFEAPQGEAADGGPASGPATNPPVPVTPAAKPSGLKPDARAKSSGAAAKPYQSEPMSYWELPQGVRDSLPEFHVTVLVYAEDPEQRFLLINGMRLKEKEQLQSGVVLDEIRRDGAVFSARNYRFLVKG